MKEQFFSSELPKFLLSLPKYIVFWISLFILLVLLNWILKLKQPIAIITKSISLFHGMCLVCFSIYAIFFGDQSTFHPETPFEHFLFRFSFAYFLYDVTIPPRFITFDVGTYIHHIVTIALFAFGVSFGYFNKKHWKSDCFHNVLWRNLKSFSSYQTTLQNEKSSMDKRT